MKIHPYVKLIYIDEESFNNAITNEKTIDVDVICCADFSSSEYENNDNRSLGDDISQYFIQLQKMLPNSEVLEKKIYPSLILNKTKYCENIIKYHYKS